MPLMPAKAKSIGSDASGAGTEKDRAIDQLCVNTIRTLAIDAVQQAKSGRFVLARNNALRIVDARDGANG